MPPVADLRDIGQLQRSCASCGLQELCLPAGIDGDDLARLDAAVRDKRVLERGRALYRSGDAFHALFVVRSGALKTFVLDGAADEQVIGFHLPGEIVGIDALASGHHESQAQALERTSMCELPFSELERITSQIPALHRQLLRVIGREVIKEHEHLVTMGQQQAQARLAIFLKSLAGRYETLRRNSKHLMLPMSRHDVASYLGLAVETVSRLFTRFEDMGVLAVQGKSVRVLRPDLLQQLCQPADGGPASGKVSQATSK